VQPLSVQNSGGFPLHGGRDGTASPLRAYRVPNRKYLQTIELIDCIDELHGYNEAETAN
jgi:hypothetical protein